MEPKETVKVNGRFRAAIRLWDSDVGAQIVVSALAERNHHVQPVNGATLKDRDQRLAPPGFQDRVSQRASQKRRRGGHRAEGRQSDAAGFKKVSSIHCSLPRSFESLVSSFEFALNPKLG